MLRDHRPNGQGARAWIETGRSLRSTPPALAIVFFSIAGVSLLIGGVGIFSVLKISIGERLYEIGLRKSMGASDAEVFVQFLIEA